MKQGASILQQGFSRIYSYHSLGIHVGDLINICIHLTLISLPRGEYDRIYIALNQSFKGYLCKQSPSIVHKTHTLTLATGLDMFPRCSKLHLNQPIKTVKRDWFLTVSLSPIHAHITTLSSPLTRDMDLSLRWSSKVQCWSTFLNGCECTMRLMRVMTSECHGNWLGCKRELWPPWQVGKLRAGGIWHVWSVERLGHWEVMAKVSLTILLSHMLRTVNVINLTKLPADKLYKLKCADLKFV